MPKWKFGEEKELGERTVVALPVTDIFVVAIAVVVSDDFLRQGPVYHDGSLAVFGWLGAVALIWGVVSVGRSLVMKGEIPGSTFFFGICLGTVFVGAALLSSGMMTGIWGWSLWGLTVTAALAFLLRKQIRKRLIKPGT